jgi:hypothetical protein
MEMSLILQKRQENLRELIPRDIKKKNKMFQMV